MLFFYVQHYLWWKKVVYILEKGEGNWEINRGNLVAFYDQPKYQPKSSFLPAYSNKFKYDAFFKSLPKLLISPLQTLAAQKTAVSPGSGRLS